MIKPKVYIFENPVLHKGRLILPKLKLIFIFSLHYPQSKFKKIKYRQTSHF